MQKTRLHLAIVGLTAAPWLYSCVDATSLARAGEAKNTDLTRFLPNDGNAVYNVTGLLRQWPPEGPKQLWRREIGWGRTWTPGPAGMG